MTEYDKLEYIHCTLQDVQSCIAHAKLIRVYDNHSISDLDEDMINDALTMVEDIREKHFNEDGELITQGDKKLKEYLEEQK